MKMSRNSELMQILLFLKTSKFLKTFNCQSCTTNGMDWALYFIIDEQWNSSKNCPLEKVEMSSCNFYCCLFCSYRRLAGWAYPNWRRWRPVNLDSSKHRNTSSRPKRNVCVSWNPVAKWRGFSDWGRKLPLKRNDFGNFELYEEKFKEIEMGTLFSVRNIILHSSLSKIINFLTYV